MIKNCRPAVRVLGIALLIAGAGRAYAQLARDMASQAIPDWSTVCGGAGLAVKPAGCLAHRRQGGSQYNLLYTDDTPESETDDGPATLPPRRAHEDTSQIAPCDPGSDS